MISKFGSALTKFISPISANSSATKSADHKDGERARFDAVQRKNRDAGSKGKNKQKDSNQGKGSDPGVRPGLVLGSDEGLDSFLSLLEDQTDKEPLGSREELIHVLRELQKSGSLQGLEDSNGEIDGVRLEKKVRDFIFAPKEMASRGITHTLIGVFKMLRGQRHHVTEFLARRAYIKANKSKKGRLFGKGSMLDYRS